MKRTEFEDILILETPYYKNLRTTYRDTVNFQRYLPILKKISPGDTFIDALSQKQGKELVYLGRKIFSLQEEFVTTYLQFLSDESTVDKWERFFERYREQLFEVYEGFVGQDNYKVFIFEVVNRKLLRDFLTKHTINESLDRKMLTAERFGVVINQLFTYIRHSLTKDIRVNDQLLIDSYGRLPLLPRCPHSETLKLLSSNFLEQGIPEPLFSEMAMNIMSAHYIEVREKVMADLKKTHTLSKEGIIDILKSHFFFPDDKTLDQLYRLLKDRAQDMLNDLRVKKAKVDTDIIALKQKIKEITQSLKEQLVHLTENFSTEEVIANSIKKLQRTLVAQGYDLRHLKNKHQEYVKNETEVKNILKSKPHDLLTFIFKNEWDPYIILLFNHDRKFSDDDIQLIVKRVYDDIRKDKVAVEVLNRSKVSGFLKDKYDSQLLTEYFREAIHNIIDPLIKTFLLEEMIDYYPQMTGTVSHEGVRYLAEEALAGRAHVVEKEMPKTPSEQTISAPVIARYRELVSVLTYDIRGSTFMGTKLRDARRENEIRKFFQEYMLGVIEKFGGIPIKDTGDGGIVVFAKNSHEIKTQKDTALVPGNTLTAVRSGLEMVRAAKNFVQENIDKYHDWFREADERTVDFEGATYATLPPSYQTIFQIGVGIASGSHPREVYLDKNAFGELDLTGMLVRESNFYSRVKAVSKSTVICDDATVYNMLLNANKFSFLNEQGLRIDPMLLDVEQGLEYWVNQKISRRGFILDLYKIFVSQLGQEVTRPGSLKLMLGIFDIELSETGEIKDGKGGRGKFLFEVSSGATK